MNILFAICREKDTAIESLQRQINILQEEVMRLQDLVKQFNEEEGEPIGFTEPSAKIIQQPTTPRKFTSTMRKLATDNANDPECCHGKMDDEMCRLLNELGYSAGVKIFESANKYYA